MTHIGKRSAMYRVNTIEKIAAPVTGSNRRWYRYVIGSDHGDTIVGQRAGTRQEVTRFAHDCVHQLNKRYPARRTAAVANVRRVNVDVLVPLYYRT